MGLTGILTDAVNRLHTVEALCPVISAQSEAEKDTKGCHHISPMTQRIILAASTTN